MNVLDSLRQFLANELRVADGATLDPELALVQSGTVDSIELMQVVAFLEKEFGINVDDTEILPKNLRSLSRIVAFVESKRAGAHPGSGT
ncbi:MAG: acyl carrier protein [Longimicrobiales bacterium]|nr:acyl carrier protein [Longimicrobiales bacterium]